MIDRRAAKSTGLFSRDPVLKQNGCDVEYWITGHSYIKRRIDETKALAGFEKSGHFFFNRPIGAGYDDALVSAVRVLRLLDARGEPLSKIRQDLPHTWQSPTMGPECADDRKYQVVKKREPRSAGKKRAARNPSPATR